jgi:hypothetical protein
MTVIAASDAEHFIRRVFAERAGIEVVDVSRRVYPDEINFVVYVREDQIGIAAAIGNELDSELQIENVRSFVIVRRAVGEAPTEVQAGRLAGGVQDQRATELIRLITARSRVSSAQPSLSYVRDAPGNIATVVAARHHLIFGRRGAGKTALLVEARRIVSAEGAVTAWANIQSMRHQDRDQVVLLVLQDILESLLSHQRIVPTASAISVDLANLFENVRTLIAGNASTKDVERLYPRVQRTISRFLEIEGVPLYIFLDDFYYLPRNDQPVVLDGLHACVRDADAWLKISSIRHLSRWWQSSPPMGLQTTHDADTIDLDVTLQQPARAKSFLENVLTEYSRRAGISKPARIFSSSALDRLVLASGAVPRDYLTLAASSIVRAQGRENSKLVGVQDVNQAAGDAANEKIQELEEDMASNVGTAERTISALNEVRMFCLQEESYTYFLVTYRDKELNPEMYSVLTDLMDVRLVHLLDAGVSDAHAAGQRSEAYLLDLSQYSGSRLKQRIHVIDFKGGKIVAHQTRTSADARTGDDARKVIAILRGAPVFKLARLRTMASGT